MCVMEVRPGQHSVTVAQACAHNVNTVRGDLDMFEKLIRARGEWLGIGSKFERIRHDLDNAYADLLNMFGEELRDYVQSGHDHPHPVTGNERVHAPAADAEEIAHVASDIAHRAAEYETR